MEKISYSKIAQLVEKVKKGDSNAFAELYTQTYQKVYFFALSLTKNEQTAQDVVQDTFIQVLKSINTLEDNKLFIAWVNRIAYNTSMKTLAKNSTMVGFDDDTSINQIPDERESMDQSLYVMHNDRRAQLMKQINALNPQLKAVILMKYYEGLKEKEIAVALDVPVGTVKSRLNTAKKRLKDLIGKKGGTTMFAFTALPIAATLAEASKSVAMKPSVAFETLVSCLGAAGMATNVAFTPVATAAAAGGTGASTATTAAVGTTVVATGAAAIVLGTYTPEISNLIYDTEITGNDAAVTVELNGGLAISSVYAVNDSDYRFYGDLQDDGTYLINIGLNGDYTIVANCDNGKSATANITIDFIDKEGPKIVDYNLAGDILTVTFNDEMSSIDFGSIYGVLPDGSRIEPVSVDDNAKTATFSYPDSDFSIYASDGFGNESEHTVTKQ